ncbi:MAG: proline--tRNA ligase [Candidatus Marinimicrobia bacterium]|nr:proline--tRNA ligase [Candidatus Neomarinimicrobiota bacterium]MCF7850614.1 proline--tRNA ligase [Candidatus Neomarinimicrobiota bacterium]MCF7903652.1 proline--tRNA ligase [Candidatus Neomarinimicrobiota bacterium]
MSKGVTKQSDDFAKWYTDVVRQAKLADYGPVKGTMVIRPYGYAIWENFQRILDRMFKDTGHVNAYFPLFIPEHFMHKEAEHVEGFAPEVAVVTHGGGKKLEEPLVVRPTSETIIWNMYKKWISSYRDLPLLINQWANVVRWEMRTRLFLRTTEFLWQEGHTAHATAEEAEEETLKILEVYRTFAEDFMAMPVITGQKSESEKFAGAVRTYSIEAMMRDGKALQSGTSHYLGQNFARAFEVTFQNTDNQEELVYATSWGVSTRLVGGLIMSHGDDKGLILPPRVAPYQVVIIPIYRDDTRALVMEEVNNLVDQLDKVNVRTTVDDDQKSSPGFKFNEWEMKGVPMRVEIGPKDVEKGQAVVVIRHSGEKHFIKLTELAAFLDSHVEIIQDQLFQRALDFREENTHTATTWDEFKDIIENKGGFVKAFWNGSADVEEKIKDETKATIRCIPFDQPEAAGKCIYTGEDSTQQVIFAKAY